MRIIQDNTISVPKTHSKTTVTPAKTKAPVTTKAPTTTATTTSAAPATACLEPEQLELWLVQSDICGLKIYSSVWKMGPF